MFSGPFAMIFYGVQIFQETGIQIYTSMLHVKLMVKPWRHFSTKLSVGVNAHMAAVVVAILRVIGGLLAIFLIKKLPRYQI